MAEPKAKAKAETKQNVVKVVSKFDRFVDLVNNIEITKSPILVEMHPWLQSNVDSGLVIVVE